MQTGYRETTRRDWLEIGFAIACYIVALAVGVWLLSVWGLVVAPLAILAIVYWHTRRSAYRCRACDSVFRISTATNLISGHGVCRDARGTLRGWTWLRCPRCGQRSRATVLRATN